MRSIEEQIGVTENAKKAFREEILIRIVSLARRGQSFDYTTHERLRKRSRRSCSPTCATWSRSRPRRKTPDAEQLRRINDVVDRLVREHGYCPVCANELLKYVGTLLNR